MLTPGVPPADDVHTGALRTLGEEGGDGGE